MNARAPEVPANLREKIRQRLSHGAVCDFLKAADKPVARSWDDIFAKNPTEEAFFLQVLEEVVCFGGKSLAVYDAGRFDPSELSQFSSSSRSILQALDAGNTSYEIFRVTRSPDGRFSSYTFSCKRDARTIFVLSRNDLQPDAQERFWTTNAIAKVYSAIEAMCFDSVIYDSREKLLYVLIDDQRYSFEETSAQFQVEMMDSLLERCPSISTTILKDLFPAIAGIYEEGSEGLIHRLAFECDTGAHRDEHLKQGQLDLRTELYHVRGKEGVNGIIRPFKVGVTWTAHKYSNLRQEVEINILGTRANAHKRGGVFGATLASEGMYNELCFALGRLSLYV